MTKAAIVSCYFIHNYGSILQSYAMQKTLDKLGIENETINVSGFIKELRRAQYLYIIKSGLNSNIFRDKFGKAKNVLTKAILHNRYTENIRKRDRKFDEFIKTNIRVSEKYFSVSELSSKCTENYATVLLGSDQLWLPSNIAADYYTLNFVPSTLNSVAYATSFGVSVLPKDSIKFAERFLPRIRHISVREYSGQKLVENISGRHVPVVIDPTLLFTGEEWEEIQSSRPLYDEPYIFCYFIGEAKQHREFVKKLKSVTGYKIVAIIHVDHYMKNDENYADETPFEVGPAEFVNLIRNATYICTDSFHCSVFSILYKKEFYAFKRYIENTDQSTNSRLDTLFDLMGIKGRILSGYEDIDSCIKNKLDYASIYGNLDAVKEYSLNYLTSALKDEGSTDL